MATVATLTSPQNGATITAPGNIALTVSTIGETYIDQVGYFKNNSLFHSDVDFPISMPHTYQWPVTAADNGTFNLKAAVQDSNDGVVYTQTISITINIVADETAPEVTEFSIPASSVLLDVPILSFIATDNFGVAGYLITESSGTPSVDNPGWSADAPTVYTFQARGQKTLYAWAKDAAGNVSEAASAQINILSTNLPALNFTFVDKIDIPLNHPEALLIDGNLMHFASGTPDLDNQTLEMACYNKNTFQLVKTYTINPLKAGRDFTKGNDGYFYTIASNAIHKYRMVNNVLELVSSTGALSYNMNIHRTVFWDGKVVALNYQNSPEDVEDGFSPYGINIFSTSGEFLDGFGEFGNTENPDMANPKDFCIVGDLAFVISGDTDFPIQVYDLTDLSFQHSFGNEISNRICTNGTYLFVYCYGDFIQIFDPNGVFIQEYGVQGSGEGEFYTDSLLFGTDGFNLFTLNTGGDEPRLDKNNYLAYSPGSMQITAKNALFRFEGVAVEIIRGSMNIQAFKGLFRFSGFAARLGSLQIEALKALFDFRAPGAISRCEVMNPFNYAVSRYDTIYSSIADYQGSILGCASDGLYLESGQDDDGLQIKAEVGIVKEDFDIGEMKRLVSVFLGVDAGALSLSVNGSNGGIKETLPTGEIKTVRFYTPHGKGKRYFEVSISNVDGSDLMLDTVELELAISKRKILE